MVIYARYSFNLDDIWMWLDIYHKKPIFNGYTPHSGRFFPLASLDLNLLAHFSQSPYVFFAFNAITVFIIGCLLWIMTDITLKGYYALRVIFLIGMLFHPGFVTVMLGICYPERLLVLFLCIFIIASMRFYRFQDSLSMIVGLLSANIAIYYKEPIFLAIGTFGSIMLLYSYFYQKDRIHKKVYIYYAGLILSALVFIALYCGLIMPHIEQTYTRNTALSMYESMLYALRGMVNFILNDSPLLLLLPALILYRIYRVVRYRDISADSVLYDSLLISAFVYICAFLALRLFEVYYLIPAYFIGFIAMVHYCFTQAYLHIKIFRFIVGICILLFFVNTLPLGVYTYVWLKSEAVKFHSSLQFIANKCKENHTKTVNLYFDGNGRGESYATWYWEYFAKYLLEIYQVSNFDVKMHNPNAKTLWQKSRIWRYDINSPLTALNTDKITVPQSADIIILNNSTNAYANATYIENLTHTYHLIYTSRAFGMPYIGIKSLIKLLSADSQIMKDITLDNRNILRLPLRDYIFEVP